MVADSKDKKHKVSAPEKGEDENSQPDEELVLSIEKLQEIQDELEKINEEASDKVLEVEQKYNELRKPVYDKRNGIIKSIPDFWLTAFLSHPILNTLVGEDDQKVFKHFTSLNVEDHKDVKLGYSITFKFEPNPYFEETALTKTYAFLEDGTTEVNVTPITWKEGMELPNGVDHEKKKKGNKRTLSDDSCFFRWFSNTKQDLSGEMQDEIAEMIRDDLWPNPLSYFNNDQDEEGFDGEEADDEDKEEDDSDEDEDEQDDDDDEEDDDEDAGK